MNFVASYRKRKIDELLIKTGFDDFDEITGLFFLCEYQILMYFFFHSNK